MTSEAWPRLDWAEHPWTPRISPDLVSHSVRHRHRGPYEAVVVPHIRDRTPILSGPAFSAATDAASEIARFDAELAAEVAPFASVLLRSESASSSMIENLTAGAKAVALAELGSTDTRNATEIVGNVAAMRAALDLADALDADAILAMHAALMRHLQPDIAGRWRTEQVWIGGTSFGPHQATFVPPHHNDVPELIDDLVAFMQRTDIPLLVQAAIAHAQFETIHPFPDGNGRTGRALIHSLLRGRGLTRNVTVPVSAGLLTDTAGYFDALTAYRDGEVAPIVTRLGEAAHEATTNGRVLVGDLHSIRSSWDERIQARRDAAAWQLAELLIRQPVIETATIANELGIAAPNAIRAIRPLVDAGILTEFTGHKRNRLWQAREVLAALDDFAARAGRRQ